MFMHNLPVLTANKFFSVRNILKKSFYEVGRASGPCLHLVSIILDEHEKKLNLWVSVWVIVGYYRHIHRHRIFYRS